MAITLNGTTGITTDGGYTGDGVSFADGTPSNTLVTTTGGNVGIGTNAPTFPLDVRNSNLNVSKFQQTGSFQPVYMTSTTNLSGVMSETGNQNGLLMNSASNYTTLWSGGAERMRIDSSGNLLVGTTSAIASGYRVNIGSSSTTNNSLALANNGTQNLQILFAGSGLTSQGIGVTTASRIYVYSNIDTSTGVYLTSGGTTWTSTSDERLKENLNPIENAVDKVCTLRAVTGNYINDEDKKLRPFLIAQDVQAVLPEAVDASNPDELGLSYTDVIPLLVASIKELKAELDTVKTELATLKGTA